MSYAIRLFNNGQVLGHDDDATVVQVQQQARLDDSVLT
jgi:hypothetical protein